MSQFAFINMEYIEQVSKDNRPFVIEMVEMFIVNTPLAHKELSSAIQNRDWDKVGFLAHKLKATYAYMGMEELRELLIFIEKSAKKREDLERLPGVFKMLVDKTREAVLELEQYKSNVLRSSSQDKL